MNRRKIALLAASLWLTFPVGAETYYVRNRPFSQVVKQGSEAMVQAEAFLKALELNWTLNGQTLELTSQPAANPGLKLAGPVTVRYGDQEITLDPAQRGDLVYLPLKPLARLCNFSVTANPSLGTVDVNRARFATDEEKAMNSQIGMSRSEEEKARQEAWSKRAAELKARREAGKDKDKEGTGEGDESQDKEKPPETKEAPPPATAANEAPPPAKEVPKEARLEVFRTDSSPDPNGVVTMTCEIKNMGDAPNKPTSGVLILKGPDRSASATNNSGATSKVWTQKTISVPAIQPGASYQFTEKYRHPSGNSMPIGNITADFKLNSTK